MMKKILILGGTQFIGRNLLEKLIKINEYEITIFNRGKTQTHLFPNIKRIIGDRNTQDVFKIGEEQWDFVIDVSCYFPHSLENVLKAIDGNTKRFVFISTCSIYQDASDKTKLHDENTTLWDCTPEEAKDTSNATYGKRKAECERILAQSNMDYISLRPALVYGAHDHTDRFYYWIYQVLNNSPVLIPDNGERLLSLTYVHDLVNMILAALHAKTHSSTYNAISHQTTSIGEIIQTIAQLEDKTLNMVNASSAFLHKNKIAQWTDMPLWIDNDDMTFNNQQVLNDFEMPITDFISSVKATIEHYRKLGFPVPKYGMSEAKRQELLNKLTN